MNFRNIASIKSDILQIQEILQGIPEDDMIERFVFEQRLETAYAQLSEAESAEAAPESLMLTFRGSPVDGSKGIYADFGGKAASSFSEAYSAIMAALNSKLQYMGPIPDRGKHPLKIVGTAVGSFGFEMELPVDEDLFAGYSGSDHAIDIFKSLLKVSSAGTDDEIAEIVQEIHPRAVRKVADFLQTLRENEAWCGIEFRDDFFRYKNIDELSKSEGRLREENIIERFDEIVGEFQGFLPQSRSFEFLTSEDRSVIRGKIDKSISDPYVLNREWLHKSLRAKFTIVQVGQGRPRYTLSSIDDLSLDIADSG